VHPTLSPKVSHDPIVRAPGKPAVKKVDHTQLAVAAAHVAAELHHADRIAGRLTLSAKNAAAIVLRAGTRAAGLSVISHFYDELATETIALSRVIYRKAVELSTIAVAEWRSSSAVTQLEAARQRLEAGTRQEELAELSRRVHAELEVTTLRFQQLLETLQANLDEIQRHMRAIDVIAVTSRLEAQHAGEFREGLIQMANLIQEQASAIKGHVSRSLRWLSN